MGCGTWGRNSFSDNLTYRHYLNITRIARPIPSSVPASTTSSAVPAAAWPLRRGARRAPRTTLARVLAAHRRGAARRPFLIAPETGRRTRTPISRASRAARACCASRGIAPGDTVGMLLHNGWQTRAIFLGTMAGGTVRAVQPARAALAACVRDRPFGLQLVFTTRDREPALREALQDVEKSGGRRGVLVEVIDSDQPELFAGSSDAAIVDARLDADSPALLMYTSGTTGTPKGALLTHRNLLAAARTVAGWHKLTPGDRVLSSLPLYHINGQVIATVTPFVSGGLDRRPAPVQRRQLVADGQVAPADVDQRGCRRSSPTCSMPRSPAAPRSTRTCASPAPPRRRFRRRSTWTFERRFGISVIEAMGMTESASVVFCNPQDPQKRKIGSPGLPCGVEARVIGRDGGVLPDGITGELMLRGSQRDARVLQGRRADTRGARARRLAAYRRSGASRCRWLLLCDRPDQGADHQGWREHRPARDRRGIAEASGRARGGGGRHSDADYGQDILACVVLKPGATRRAGCARIASRARQLQDAGANSALSPSCRRARRARCSGCGCWSNMHGSPA
jgi:long-chain acyl-CoA synthetase